MPIDISIVNGWIKINAYSACDSKISLKKSAKRSSLGNKKLVTGKLYPKATARELNIEFKASPINT